MKRTRPRTIVKRKILLALEMADASSRMQLMGVFRYAAKGRHWDIRILQTPEEFNPAAVRNTVEGRVDGVISCVAGVQGAALALAQSPLPSVFMDVPFPKMGTGLQATSFVKTNDVAIGRLGAQHFCSLGDFAAYAFVSPPERPSWAQARADAFRREIRTRRHVGVDVFQIPDDVPSEKAYDKLVQFITERPKPLAVLAASDKTARTVLEACGDAQLEVPQQVSVLGVDNDELLCDLAMPQLSSISPDFETEGYRAAQALDRLMKSRTPLVQTVLCPVKGITERASTRSPAPAADLVRRALAYIHEHVREGISVDDVVQQLGASRRLADLRFRQLQRLSIGEVIRRERLRLVEHLLLKTTLSPSRIAVQCGFPNANALGNFFRSQHGVSPTRWRKNLGVGY